MEDSAKKQSKIAGFFSGVKAEFKKIQWPNKQSTFKQSVAVVIVSVVVGVVIAIIDFMAQYGIDFLVSLGK